MKIISYSDLHLEFRHGWSLPSDLDGDVLVLAGDIITFRDFSPLESLLRYWEQPVLFVAGNHEYYTCSPMRDNEGRFRNWLAEKLPQVYFLRNEGVTIEGVNFFGGTMWTNFKSGSTASMRHAKSGLNDFLYIRSDDVIFTPEFSVELHQQFIATLEQWFDKRSPGPNVVITHHAPVINPKSQYLLSPLEPAFVSYEMSRYIEKYEPTLWIYGHTHECDAQRVGKTRVISNQFGYPHRSGGYESTGAFDDHGCPFDISSAVSPFILSRTSHPHVNCATGCGTIGFRHSGRCYIPFWQKSMWPSK